MTSHDSPSGMTTVVATGAGRSDPPDAAATKCAEYRTRAVLDRLPSGRWAWGAALACWGTALFGALKIAEMPGEFGESLCGVWGCLPPMQALVAMHLFWMLLLVPPAAAAGLRLPRVAAIRLGVLSAMGSAATAAAVLGLDLARWLSAMGPELHGYAGRRILYSLAAYTDVPMVQAVLAGLLCWGIASRRTPS